MVMVTMALVVIVITDDVGDFLFFLNMKERHKGGLVTTTWPSLLVVMFFFPFQLQGTQALFGVELLMEFYTKKGTKHHFC